MVQGRGTRPEVEENQKQVKLFVKVGYARQGYAFVIEILWSSRSILLHYLISTMSCLCLHIPKCQAVFQHFNTLHTEQEEQGLKGDQQVSFFPWDPIAD